MPAFVGPHEDRELELMMAGIKPLSMFAEEIDQALQCFPEADFDALVVQGKLVKKVSINRMKAPDGKDVQIRHVLYALPGEEWRINAMQLVGEIYRPLPGWRPDLERVIGALLGYDANDVEEFLEWLPSRGANVKSG
jgi:hypothetical protein